MVADEVSEPAHTPNLEGEAAPEVDATPGADVAPGDGAVPEAETAEALVPPDAAASDGEAPEAPAET